MLLPMFPCCSLLFVPNTRYDLFQAGNYRVKFLYNPYCFSRSLLRAELQCIFVSSPRTIASRTFRHFSHLPTEDLCLMNEIPPPLSSEAPEMTPEKKKASSETEDFVPSVLDGPEVDVSEYLEAKQRAAQRTRRFLQFALGVAVIAVPVTYLKLNGSLSTNGIRRTLRQKVVEPGNGASNSKFGLAAPNNPANSAATKVIPKTVKSKAVAEDLKKYVFNDLKRINPDELRALAAFDRVTGKNFTTESNTFSTVRDTILPSYSRFIQQAEAIQPKTPEVQAVHKIFIQSAKVKILAFRHLLEGRGDSSSAWQYGVKAEFDASAQLANQFKLQINGLAADQDVTLP